MTDVDLVGDLYHILSRLAEELRDGAWSAHSSRLNDLILGHFEAGRGDDAFPVRPPRALWEIRQALGREDMLISDVGLHKLWIARMFPAHEPDTVMIANGLAGMGIALPTAIAAKLVHPERKVVTVNGDGGFLMNVQELETAVRLRTPIVNVIWENRQFGSIVWKQDKKFGRHFGTDFTNPDFVGLAGAFGMPAWRIEAVDDVRPHAAPRARPRRPVADRAADRLLAGRRHLTGTRNGDRRRMSITASQEQAVLEAVPHRLFIGGEWRDASGGATLGVEDPATGETLVEIADATPEDAAAALDAACAVQKEWAAHAPRERGEILRRAFETITERADELALLMTLEMGKPVAESKAEVTYASEFLRWFAEEAVRIEGRFATAPNGQGRLITMRQPVGPCYAITPWNFPMAMGTRKIGPAVAAGCTMIIKPAQQTPLSMLALAQILEEAGLPAGRAERAHVELLERGLQADHRRPAAAQAHVHRLDRGRAQARRAVRAGPAAHVDGAGRQRAVPRLRRRRRRRRRRGRADREDAQHGRGLHGREPLPRRRARAGRVRREARGQARRDEGRARHRGRRQGRAADRREPARQGRRARARRRSARARRRSSAARRATARATSTSRPCSPASPPDAELLREEIFGPVAPVIGFDDEEAAIAAANDTEYGLVAYVYTSDIKRAFRVIEGLETGMVGLNQGLVSNAAAPFGGVKASGFGREGGKEGIDEYLETKYVAMAM